MSIELCDNNNEPILIKTKNGYYFEVVWKNTTKKFTKRMYKALKAEDITTIENFQINEMKVLVLKIYDEKITIVYEKIDQLEFIDSDGCPMKFEISGPFGQRRLYITWEIKIGFNEVSSCAVDDSATTANIKFIKILSHPQDMPHGVLVSIDGIEHEALSNQQKYDNNNEKEQNNYYRNYMWQTIKTKLDTETDVETAFKILENMRLINILENKDVITLARNIDQQNSLIEKLTADLASTKTFLEKQIQNNTELSQARDILQTQNNTYRHERATFKQELITKLSNALL